MPNDITAEPKVGIPMCRVGDPQWNCGSCSDPVPDPEPAFYGIGETGTGLDEPVIVQQGDDRYEVDFLSVAKYTRSDVLADFAKTTSPIPPKHQTNHPTSEGPEHYRRHSIQPIQVIQDWNLPYELGNVLKYISRFDVKGGIKDLQKAKHYLELMLARLGGGDEPL